ncbi:UDP-2,3-diacylglucosamine diphosphatase [Gayadomonas joobiniege]|uniref:UDP-2,3-diacylglucosamine diphosphatase n=1 Tax=Gayadomonas joobiniege TaxID=1234606 RepID=UPI00035D9455|nr:UDP-2,3-diacylglucosamine diphosphatase [Gayadomonas joobiniege]
MANTKTQYQSIFLSDIHLGCRDCKAEYLLDLLEKVDAKTIYLVGDIFDIWALEKRFNWPQSHHQVVDTLIEKAKNGVKVIYVPGNHDEKVRRYIGMTFADIEIHSHYIHTTVDNKKFIVVHGDEFDGDVCLGAWQSRLGDVLYDLLLFLNRTCFKIRKLFGFGYWSLAGYIKSRVKGANEAIERYRQAAIEYAIKNGTDGIICGHIHQPDVIYQDNILYCNDGDWLENCTMLAENLDGSIELIYWTETVQRLSHYSAQKTVKTANQAA